MDENEVKSRAPSGEGYATCLQKKIKNMTKEENKKQTTVAVAEMIRNAREELG